MLKMRKFRKIQVDDLKKKNQYRRVMKVKIVFSHIREYLYFFVSNGGKYGGLTLFRSNKVLKLV